MIKKLELYLKDVVRGKKKGFFPSIIKLLLHPLSWFFKAGVTFRNWLYDQGWMRCFVPPVPLVISVGNIVAGGTGKTPLTMLLASHFYERFTLAILSRGYRSKVEHLENPTLLSEGQGPLFPATFCGDEPFLCSQRFPKAIVVVGGNRKKASFLAAKMGTEVIILDDAMQHRRLARDFDVIILDVEDPFGQGYFLPRGFLREGAHSLARASIIVLNHIQSLDQFNLVKALLQPYTSAPVVGAQQKTVAIRDIKGQEVDYSTDIKKVGMFCAIAHPDHFKRTLEAQGFQVVAEYILPDHEIIQEKALENFAQLSLKREALWIVCTEKDRVKLSPQLSFSLPIIWLQMDLQITIGQEEWQKFLTTAEMIIK
jgi:tetraacyldisaccharide 4'-kinase